jgi:hypothetical protein
VKKKIVSAITKKIVLRFIYNGRERVVEPQTYGVSKTGREILRARQIGGSSFSGESRIAKLFNVEKICALAKTQKHFASALPQHNPNDSAMTKIFATLPVAKLNRERD